MKTIRKTFQGAMPENKILNSESNSQTDTYSCDYINNMKVDAESIDELPVGTRVEYNGTEVPDGWEEVVEESDDSGWIYPTLNNGWSSPYSSAPTRYRKIGKMVQLESFVDATADAENIIFTLPEGFRPSPQYYRYIAYNANGTSVIDIQSGNVYVNGKSGALTWLAINHTFMVD